jgi:hypothetical protein
MREELKEAGLETQKDFPMLRFVLSAIFVF